MIGRAIKDFVFYLGLAAILTHELDATARHEWRLIPGFASLPDATAMTLFVAAHVPLFVGLMALIASRNRRTRGLSRLAFAGFLVVHALLHVLFSGHADYEFSSALSQTLIFGGAAMGAVYLAIVIGNRLRRPWPYS